MHNSDDVNKYLNLPKEKFVFVKKTEKIFDTKFETKAIGYFHDAFIRFRKNKGSVFAAIVLFILILFATLGEFVSPYSMDFNNRYLAYLPPKIPLLEPLGIMDGTEVRYSVLEVTYNNPAYYPEGSIIEVIATHENLILPPNGRLKPDGGVEVYTKGKWVDSDFIVSRTYDLKVDVYKTLGVKELLLTEAEYNELNANIPDEIISYTITSNNTYRTTIDYYEYITFKLGHEPYFWFGSTASGQDIFTWLSSGAKTSLLLGVIVSFVNLMIGLVIGAISGYYGGNTDLFIQRITEILTGIPFIVVITLISLKLGAGLFTLFFAYIAIGWVGTSDIVRSQFYRYKGHEYVLASRTLGAKDSRLMFRHILPNGIGPLVTSAVLFIPSVIFTESMLSYLGIIQLTSMTSIGTMLSQGQPVLQTEPYVIFFPAVFISLLMISFNLFGNGLRDAFNPTLRGGE